MEDAGNGAKTGTINIGVVYNDKSSGEEGVVILVDRKISSGSVGEQMPYVLKVAPVAHNIAVTMSGSGGHGQMSAETLQSFVRDRKNLYEEAVAYFDKMPVLSKKDLDEIRQQKATEDIMSGKAEQLNELIKEMDDVQKRLNSEIAVRGGNPQNSDRNALASDLQRELFSMQQDYNASQQEYRQSLAEKIVVEGQKKVHKKMDDAERFFDIDEFQLEIQSSKNGRYVHSAVPVERRGWGGSKIFTLPDVAFQRVRNTYMGSQANLEGDVYTIDSGEVFPTVDGMANLLGNIHRSLKEYSYQGLVGGINPYDGPHIFLVEGWGVGGVYERFLGTSGSGSTVAEPIMKKERQKILEGKGYLARDDALNISLMGGIEAITKDNYCGPPFDMVIIKRNGKMGRIASYKVTIDASRDSGHVTVPASLSIEVMTKSNGNDMYYKAAVCGSNVELYQMPEVGKYTEPVKINDAKLEGDVKDVARSCFNVMNKYADKKQTMLK